MRLYASYRSIRIMFKIQEYLTKNVLIFKNNLLDLEKGMARDQRETSPRTLSLPSKANDSQCPALAPHLGGCACQSTAPGLPPRQAPYLHANDFHPLQLQIIRLPGNRKEWPFERLAYIFHYQNCKYPMSF